ncbi:sugar lactone lactonase YvrE [Rathayibacter sp. PhB93]|uniref:SMP-30/gluconolactonase/LRE family protein n=1 Tax=unclassified Rathayibacter TaxID=2609250 RepID=UPI000F4606C9|nr:MULTISPECIES: SMP-30/gluconolactonase/LRE family protein [unclassified Rathayibacter]ROQ04627.1 sugar lactone lactonase YvrE [Rathayibacter sp. PhB93]TDQ13465.1 sugar lactone lactonase YvrE [Rathayibacter sp. PhB1]
MTYTLETLIEGGAFFEGPRWNDGRWYVSDFFEHHVLAVSSDGDTEVVAEVPGQPSGLGWLPDGSLLIVSMNDKRLLKRSPDGTLSEHADLSSVFPGKANDMVVDDQGRAYVGNFGFAELDPVNPILPPTVVALVTADGAISVAADDLYFPNGSVVTADGSTLIVGEAMAGRYTAFTIQPDGTLTDRRVWAQFDQTVVGGPDGCTLDAENHIWMADPLGGPLRRAAPGGAIVDQITPPEGLTIFACALGGDDGKTLLMCAAGASAFDGTERGTAMLLTTRVTVPHAGRP